MQTDFVCPRAPEEAARLQENLSPTPCAPCLRAIPSSLRPLLLSALLFVGVATPAAAQIRAELVVSGLTQPVAFVQDPSTASVQVIVQQNGRIRAVKNGALQAADFLDLSSVVLDSGEQGLLGFAFAPDYAVSGRFFVNFINLSGDTVIARFVRSASDPLRANPASRFDLLWPTGQRFLVQPFANHNGGNLVFGPDGFLYIGMGDGGSGDDPLNNAQNPTQWLGKMLRIDVNVSDSDPEGYNVPASNPFVGQSGVRGEIWSFGLRNPWRWSFDNVSHGGTGALVIGDVGQGAWEEIDYEPAGRGGRNYGWRLREGAHNNVTGFPPFSQPLTEPIFEYSHAVGQSITGGYVYRGAELGFNYRGRYFFADFVSSRIWSLKLSLNAGGEATTSDLVEHTAELGGASANPSSFGEDAAGELYVVSYAGAVYRIRSVNATTPTRGRPRPAGAPVIGPAVPRGSNGAPTLSASQSAIVLASVADVMARALPDQPEVALAILAAAREADRVRSEVKSQKSKVRSQKYGGHGGHGGHACLPSF